jgi:hypothetical protein
VDAGGAGRAEGVLRPLVQDRVLGDERAVEVGGDELDVVRKVVRERQPDVAWLT